MLPATQLTAEELLGLSIPDKRVELVRGVLVVREPAGYAHGRIAMDLAVRLANHAEGAAAGQVFAAGTGVHPGAGTRHRPCARHRVRVLRPAPGPRHARVPRSGSGSRG